MYYSESHDIQSLCNLHEMADVDILLVFYFLKSGFSEMDKKKVGN